MKIKKYSLLGASFLSAGVPFLCCWTPAILTGVAGVTGISSGFEWLHPVRPYMYSMSFLFLGVAHYRVDKDTKFSTLENNKDENECGCSQNPENSTKNKSILWLTTFLVFFMMIINYFLEW